MQDKRVLLPARFCIIKLLEMDSAFNNLERPHGRYCYGKTPMQTFNESITLAKQKLLNQVSPAA